MTEVATRAQPLEAAARPPAMKYVEANGIRFAYLEQGEGPLVLLLHGFPDNAWSYRRQLHVLARAGYRAIAPFLRGYAPTDVPQDGRFDPATLGEDLHALILALTDRREAFVVGMDWGGTATHAALVSHPEVLIAVVVMNTAHPLTLGSVTRDPELVQRLFHFWFFQPETIVPLVAAEGLPIVDYLWRIWSPRALDQDHIRSVKETLSAPGTLGAALSYYRQLYQAAITRTFPAGPITTPTLSLFGADDPTAKYAHL
jgi:pimeloyl-ACP methyl ester carboxylesterase